MDEEFDLDAMLEEGDSLDIEDPSDKGPTESIVNDATEVLKDEVGLENSKKRLKKYMKKAMPGDIGDRLDDAESAVDDTLDEIDKATSTIRKKAAQTLGSLSNVLPSSVADPINRMRSWLHDDESTSMGQQQSEDDRIREEVNSILEQQSRETLEADVTAKTEELLQKKDTELLATIAASLNKANIIKTDVDSKYFRKSLELQIKQTFTLSKMYELMYKDSEIRTKQLEAIVRNTSMPDFVKTKSVDYLKYKMKSSVLDGGMGMIKSSNVYKNIAKNAKNKVSEIANNITGGLDTANTVTDMLSMASENGISPVMMALSMAVGGGLDKTTDVGMKKLMENIASSDSDILKNINKYTSDPIKGMELLIKDIEESENEQGFTDKAKLATLKQIKELMGSTDTLKSTNIVDTNKLNEATFLDNKLKKSIDTVIPGLLGKILNEVSSIRKGSKTLDKDDEVTFDYKANKFSSKKIFKKKVLKEISESSNKIISAISNSKIVSKLFKGETFNKAELKVVMRMIGEYIMSTKTLSPYFMLEDGLLVSITDEKLKKKLRRGIKNLLDDKSEEGLVAIQYLQKELDFIRRSVTNFGRIASEAEDNGTLDVLEDVGLLNEKDHTTISSNNITKVLKDRNDKEIDKLLEKFNSERGNGTYKKGGYTGDGDDDEIAGLVHKKEFVLNKSSLNDIISAVKEGDKESLLEIGKNITDEIGKTSKEYKDTAISKIENKIDDLRLKGDNFISTLDVDTQDNIKRVVTNIKNGYGVKGKAEELLKTSKEKITDLGIDTKNNIKGFVNDNITREHLEKIRELADTAREYTDTFKSTLSSSSKFLQNEAFNLIGSLPSISKTLTKGLTDTINNIEEVLPKKDELISLFSKENITKKSEEVYEYIKNKAKLDKFGFSLQADNVKESITDAKKTLLSTRVNTGSMVSRAITGVKVLLGKQKEVTPELLENMSSIEDIVNEKGVEAVIRAELVKEPFPESVSEAKSLYKSIFNILDPTGGIWNRLVKEDGKGLIDRLQQFHASTIEDNQKGILRKAGEMLESGAEKSVGILGSIKNQLLSVLPKPLRDKVDKLLDNKFTKFAGKTLGRFKNIGKSALSTTMDELRVIGKNGKEMFIDPSTGKLHMPNAMDLAKFAGKSYFGSIKAVSKGVKTLYGESFGLANDTIGLGTSIVKDATVGAVKKSAKKGVAKLKAKIKPPIPRKLYKAWTKGYLNAGEVMDQLETEEQKENWKKWLEANTRKGLSLPDLLLKTGKWYAKSIVGTSKVVKPTYKTASKTAGDLAKLGVSAGLKFFGLKFKKKNSDDELPKDKEEPKSVGGVIAKRIKRKKKKGKNKAEEVTTKLDSTLDKISGVLKDIAKPKKKKAFNDKDGDGDRDGNYKDRLAKLYGKKDKDPTKPTLIQKVREKGSGLLGTLMKFAPFLIGGLKMLFNPKLIKKAFGWLLKGIVGSVKKLGSFIWKGVKSLTGKLFSGLKSLGSSIAKSVGSALNKAKNFAKKGVDFVKDKFTKAKGAVSRAWNKTKGLFSDKDSKAKNFVKGKASAFTNKIKSFLKVLKTKIITKLGVKGGAKLTAKIAARLVPGLGLALLVYDAAMVNKYMTVDKMSFKSAVSKAVIGFDIFSDDDVPVDEDGKPIKPDEDETLKKVKDNKAVISTKKIAKKEEEIKKDGKKAIVLEKNKKELKKEKDHLTKTEPKQPVKKDKKVITPTVVNVKTTKDETQLTKTTLDTNDILNKSMQIQYKTYEVMSNILNINREMLNIMKNNSLNTDDVIDIETTPRRLEDMPTAKIESGVESF